MQFSPRMAETEWSEFLLTTTGYSAVGSAGGLGPSGRGFKSLYSDQIDVEKKGDNTFRQCKKA